MFAVYLKSHYRACCCGERLREMRWWRWKRWIYCYPYVLRQCTFYWKYWSFGWMLERARCRWGIMLSFVSVHDSIGSRLNIKFVAEFANFMISKILNFNLSAWSGSNTALNMNLGIFWSLIFLENASNSRILSENPKMFGIHCIFCFLCSPSSIKKLGEYFVHLPVLSSTKAPSNPYLSAVWLYSKERRHSLKSNHKGQPSKEFPKLPRIYLGKTCCRSLDMYSFAEFLRSADKKVILKTAQLDWGRIIFENTRNPTKLSCGFLEMFENVSMLMETRKILSVWLT